MAVLVVLVKNAQLDYPLLKLLPKLYLYVAYLAPVQPKLCDTQLLPLLAQGTIHSLQHRLEVNVMSCVRK